MTDLTDLFAASISKDINWRTSRFYDFLEQAGLLDITISYWKDEENWASIVSTKENKVIGIIWQKYPLVFLESNHAFIKNAFPENFQYVEWKLVDSIYTSDFMIDYDRFSHLFESTMDFNCFSVETLWFNTNTR